MFNLLVCITKVIKDIIKQYLYLMKIFVLIKLTFVVTPNCLFNIKQLLIFNLPNLLQTPEPKKIIMKKSFL